METTAYSVFGDVLCEITGRVFKVIEEELLLYVLVLLQEILDAVGDRSSVVLHPKLNSPQALVCPLDEIFVAGQFSVQLLKESLVCGL